MFQKPLIYVDTCMSRLSNYINTNLSYITNLTLLMFTLTFVYPPLIARQSDDEVELVKVGNFAVPGATQPFAVLGFGQTIIDKYNTLGYLSVVSDLGKRQNFTLLDAEILYGIRDDLSLLLAFPTAVKYTYDGYHSSGSLDLLVQLEYAAYAQHKPTYTNQISLVSWMTLPTGNECKIPATGFGSPSFFLGFVLLHLATEWYAYTSHGVLLTTKNDSGLKPGNQFLYQAGLGKNIAYVSDKWTLMWMVEFNGLYEKKSKTNGILDNNSGSNSIIVGPALYFATKSFVLQLGAAPVVYQNLFGEQLKSSCLLSICTGYRFN